VTCDSCKNKKLIGNTCGCDGVAHSSCYEPMHKEPMIMSEKTGDIRKIRNIEDKYGLPLFRMGLSHLADVGHSRFDDDAVEEWIRNILAQGEKDRVSGATKIMSPEFKCEIVRCAAELAKFNIWTLFAYIKKHVVVECEKNKYLLLNCFEREIGTPEMYETLEDAQCAMKAALIDAMDGVDDNVFADYNEGDDYGLESCGAWLNHRHGNHDWKIFNANKY